MADDETAVEEAAPPPPPEERHGALVVRERGQVALHTDRARYHGVIAALRSEGFDLCVDVTAVDYLTYSHRPLPAGVGRERFEVVVNLLSINTRDRVRVRCQVPETEAVVPTIVDLYAGADAPEREAYDMFGIVFDGHPDLTRILMPEDWEGHPLRKDYAVGRIPVQFQAAPGPR